MNSDDYIHERAKRFGVSNSTICRNLKQLNFTYKKTWQHPKADQNEREVFVQYIDFLKARHPLVYVDEVGFSVDALRRHGYSEKGARCLESCSL